MGSIYDFRNTMHQGQGRLNIININGSTDSGSIMAGLMNMTRAGGMRLDKKPAEKVSTEQKPTVH